MNITCPGPPTNQNSPPGLPTNRNSSPAPSKRNAEDTEDELLSEDLDTAVMAPSSNLDVGSAANEGDCLEGSVTETHSEPADGEDQAAMTSGTESPQMTPSSLVPSKTKSAKQACYFCKGKFSNLRQHLDHKGIKCYIRRNSRCLIKPTGRGSRIFYNVHKQWKYSYFHYFKQCLTTRTITEGRKEIKQLHHTSS